MSIGGFFLLILVIIVVVALGGAVFAIAARGRQRQLSSKGGTIDARRPDEEPGEEPRPEHVEVDTEQRTRFIGTR